MSKRLTVADYMALATKRKMTWVGEKAPKSSEKSTWICPNGHEWSVSYSNVRAGQNCPACRDPSSRFKTSLADGAPRGLIQEWHPTKNGDLTPDMVGVGSTKKVWWLGECGHEWQTSPGNRFHQKRITACPFCSNARVSPENNLLAMAPELASQWNYEKNGKLRPEHLTYKSSRKVWWRCPRIRQHEWQASLNDRHKYGCPHCYSHISKPHIRLYAELLPIFPDLVIHHRVDGLEFDIFSEEFALGIEYDGARWHKSRFSHDYTKNKKSAARNIKVIRLRESGLRKISPNDISIKGTDVSKADLLALLEQIDQIVCLNAGVEKKIGLYRKHKGFWNEEKFFELLAQYPSPLEGQSVKETNPDLVSQWNVELNDGLMPENFSAGSNQVIKWTCDKGHVWRVSIKRRARGDGCPYCDGKRVAKENSLAARAPEIAAQWNFDRNGDLTPDKVTYKSKKKVWWTCPKNSKHEWLAGVGDRHRFGCPYCSGRKVTPDNSLAAVMPGLAKEWHLDRNKDLTPNTVSPQSSKNVWWRCSRDATHEWQANIGDRYRGNGCPFCSGRKATKETSLSAVNPVVARQWHPDKNGDLSPDQVRPNSHKKAWWCCPKDPRHVWEANIQSRNRGHGCPFCAGKRKVIQDV